MGKCEVFIFSDVYDKYKNLINEETPIFIVGTPSNRMDGESTLKFIAKEIYLLSGIRDRLSNSINIRLDMQKKSEENLDFIKQLSTDNKGKCNIILHLETNNGLCDIIKSRKFMMDSSTQTITILREKFGNSNVWIS